MSLPKDFRQQIYRLVQQIPAGQVATYGQIAALLGQPRAARQVGYAMAACPANVPWQRVVNARGEVSRRANPGDEDYQRILLEAEEVAFNDRGRVDLKTCGWAGPLEAERWKASS